MLKFIRGKTYTPSAERLKIQKELFHFKKSALHGFPNKPSAIAFDPQLNLLCIGTKSGGLRIYGNCGFEFHGQHENDVQVTDIVIVPNQGTVITICCDNSMHLWELNESQNEKWILQEKLSTSLEGKLKKISAHLLKSCGSFLLIGTEGGNIYELDIEKFEITENIIYQDIVTQSVPSDYKVNPGAVEAILEHPIHSKKILIGYNRGLIVLYNCEKMTAEQTFIAQQVLESVSWLKEGNSFVSSHNDGSYVVWNTMELSDPVEESVTPWGPFACKAITKIVARCIEGGHMLVYSGGMPRADYGDKYVVTITTINSTTKDSTVLDLTSKIIDFLVVDGHCSDNNSNASKECRPEVLIILAEEEIVAIDLSNKDYGMMCPPYLYSLHSSAITCSEFVSNVPEDLYQSIMDLSGIKEYSSKKQWPTTEGDNIAGGVEVDSYNLLLTGHEDGVVRVWDASWIFFRLIHKVTTQWLFEWEEPAPESDQEEQWPPFKKVGFFDPFSDDPRLAVKKICLCTKSGTLIAAGTAGQVVFTKLNPDVTSISPDVSTINLVSERDNFVWKGHEKLQLNSNVKETGNNMLGFIPYHVVQIIPPAAVTGLTYHHAWGLLALGTAHGFTLYDTITKTAIMHRCTLNPNDQSGAGDNPMSRRKSFKKSLRESFRRLRKGRSQRNVDRKRNTSVSGSQVGLPGPIGSAPGDKSESAPVDGDSDNTKPVERQVEARSGDDSLASMVRCLYLGDTYILSASVTTPSLWVGTNSGSVFIFTLRIPRDAGPRKDKGVTCQLSKEIQLKHRAPVVAIHIFDGNSVPLEERDSEATKIQSNDIAQHHRVLISSEEQFKVFTLPNLKPYHKYKLTAHEGSRVRKVGYMHFYSSRNKKYSEYCIVSINNMGELIVLSVPDLRKQLSMCCIKKEDINGISSVVLGKLGEGFYLISSSELQRFSLSKINPIGPHGKLILPEGARLNQMMEIEDTNTSKDFESKMPLSPVPEEKSVDITIDSVKEHSHNYSLGESGDLEISVTKTEVTTEVKKERVEETISVVRTIPAIIDVNSTKVDDKEKD